MAASLITTRGSRDWWHYRRCLFIEAATPSLQSCEPSSTPADGRNPLSRKDITQEDREAYAQPGMKRGRTTKLPWARPRQCRHALVRQRVQIHKAWGMRATRPGWNWQTRHLHNQPYTRGPDRRQSTAATAQGSRSAHATTAQPSLSTPTCNRPCLAGNTRIPTWSTLSRRTGNTGLDHKGGTSGTLPRRRPLSRT